MAKTTKTAGFRVRIDAFIPAEHKDIGALKIIQENADHAVKTFGPAAEVMLDVEPVRR